MEAFKVMLVMMCMVSAYHCTGYGLGGSSGFGEGGYGGGYSGASAGYGSGSGISGGYGGGHSGASSGYGSGSGISGGYGGGHSGGSDSYGQEEHHEAKPYTFGYAVKDFKKGTNFNQHESSDGHNVKGQYVVQLPDGRTQVVSYDADWKNGYHADVKYIGEAHHPEIYGHEIGGYGYGASSGSSDGHGYGGSSAGYGQASSSNFQSLSEGSSHGADFGSSYGSSASSSSGYRK